MSDVRKLQYLLRLKETERICLVSSGPEHTRHESVAEHIYGCFILAAYFLAQENFQNIDKRKVFELLLFHDMPEIETGDISCYQKTNEDNNRELEAVVDVTRNIPSSLTHSFSSAYQEYVRQETLEAKFCKAIDKLEPVIQTIDRRAYCISMGGTEQITHEMKAPYIRLFPEIYKVYEEAMHILFRE
ncbi:MAG: hypothetical protein RL557_402 [archaeon]|jgi:putative hydrolase of HD superfamily